MVCRLLTQSENGHSGALSRASHPRVFQDIYMNLIKPDND